VRDIGLILLAISFVLLLTMVVITMIVPSAGRRLRRYNAQREALRSRFASSAAASLELDWAIYGEVPKQEMIILGRRHSWQFASDSLTPDGWRLRFTRSL
jgi:ABC-type transport system involved in cytochrome bd biosynthesis fused ATPase/permease subunit